MPLRSSTLHGMKKRVLAAALWFYASWYAWSTLAHLAGVTDLVGPVLGILAAVLIGVDPLRRIWDARDQRSTPMTALGTAADPA